MLLLPDTTVKSQYLLVRSQLYGQLKPLTVLCNDQRESVAFCISSKGFFCVEDAVLVLFFFYTGESSRIVLITWESSLSTTP